MKTLNCSGKLIDLTVPKVMGIVNVTPDSFYDGGQTVTKRKILLQAEKMLNDGATFLDIGGYSSRPGAKDVSETEETERVTVAISAILEAFPQAIVSIDTFRSTVAKAAVEHGASIVNDISGGMLDDKMLATVATLQVPYILMHMKGTPQNMVHEATYKDLIKEILFYFSERITEARNLGINDVMADPGFGFAKNIKQNFELLNNLDQFTTLGVPYLVGISRKSMIYRTLQTESKNALNGTTALHSVALLKGASVLRVHDVKEAMECITLLQNLVPLASKNRRF